MQREKSLIREPEAIAARITQVRDRIRSMIHQGELQPGERINEQALAQQLQVGRAMAREALRSLEQAGLIRIVPNRGAEVRRLSLADALHLYDIRAGLARTSGRLIALRITADDEEALLALNRRMDAVAEQRDAAQYHDLNEAFHTLLMETTKNPRLIALNLAIEDELKLYLRKGVFTIAQIRASQAEHTKILAAITGGQPDAAAEAFEQHILTGKQRMLDTLGGEDRQTKPAPAEERARD